MKRQFLDLLRKKAFFRDMNLWLNIGLAVPGSSNSFRSSDLIADVRYNGGRPIPRSEFGDGVVFISDSQGFYYVAKDRDTTIHKLITYYKAVRQMIAIQPTIKA